MIRHLSLSNFKAFGAEQQVPLRPITLVFGANSSGKSSIIHSLLLAHHVQQKQDWHVGPPLLAGDSVDLGGFYNYIHRHDTNKIVRLVLECDVPPSVKRQSVLSQAKSAKLTLQVEAQGSEWRNDDVERRLPRLRECQVDLDGIPLVKLARNETDVLGIASLEFAHPMISQLVREYVSHVQGGEDSLLSEVQEAMTSVCGSADLGDVSFFPYRVTFAHDLFGDLAMPDEYWERSGTPSGRLQTLMKGHFPDFLSKLFTGLHHCFADQLGCIEYLGPLRTLPERFLPVTASNTPSWKSGGEFTWQRLLNVPGLLNRINATLNTMDVHYQLKALRLADEDSVKDAVEEYLRYRVVSNLRQNAILLESLVLTDEEYRDYLGAHPELRRLLTEAWHENQTAQLDTPAAASYCMEDARKEVINKRLDKEKSFRDEWEECCLGYPFKDQTSILPVDAWVSGAWDQIATKLKDRREDLKLVDGYNQTPVNHRDVGVGISQVMPVLVHALASTNKLITIEQPEIHLHPAQQSNLGDIFIESSLGQNKNQFLIETHSEHLILRLLRRVRETTNGELEPGGCPIRPSDISVLYVQPGDNGSTVMELPVTEDGDFAVPWPGGFFAERGSELF